MRWKMKLALIVVVPLAVLWSAVVMCAEPVDGSTFRVCVALSELALRGGESYLRRDFRVEAEESITCFATDAQVEKMREVLASAYDRNPSGFTLMASNREDYVRSALPFTAARFARPTRRRHEVLYAGENATLHMRELDYDSGRLVRDETRYFVRLDEGRYRVHTIDHIGKTIGEKFVESMGDDLRQLGTWGIDDVGRLRFLVGTYQRANPGVSQQELAHALCSGHGVRSSYGSVRVEPTTQDGVRCHLVTMEAFVGGKVNLVCDAADWRRIRSRTTYYEDARSQVEKNFDYYYGTETNGIITSYPERATIRQLERDSRSLVCEYEVRMVQAETLADEEAAAADPDAIYPDYRRIPPRNGDTHER